MMKQDSFFVRNLSTFITIAALLSTLVGSWYTVQSTIDQVKRDMDRLHSRNEAYEIQLRALEIQNAQDTQNLRTVTEDVREIKEDVKTLLRKIH
jgi:septal ring factor EnvC (AmiA/AmiB activator)